MTVTPTAKVVTLPVDATAVGAIKTGAAVTLVRPDNKEVAAKVTAVSTTVDGSVADLDSASVQVKVTTESHPGVLAVPVGALVALREGGYAVQVAGGRLLAVQTGMFAKDLVEITGQGLVEGLRVVSAS
jgi:hypothetical protein